MPVAKTVLITGASSGFGLLTSVTLARRGWRVLATMRDLKRREKLENAARAAGVLDRIEFIALDVTDNAKIAELAVSISARIDAVDEANADSPRLARLDAIINNAGFAMAGFAEDVSDAELRRQFDTNFFGAAAVTRAFLPLMRRQGSGHVVMISSISGRMGFPGVSSYSASKFALEGWAETLRLEMKPLGVQIVLVEPGSFETDIWTRNAIFSARSQDENSPNAARTSRLMNSREARKLKADPQVVADGIAAILDDPRPRLRYVFGGDARLGLLLKGVLPSKILEWMLIRVSGIGA
jgi:NAD(P)-dependent dehydrogenase (short-subunit alcohol dehydrogenase family)